jgi:hypothetical protein
MSIVEYDTFDPADRAGIEASVRSYAWGQDEGSGTPEAWSILTGIMHASHRGKLEETLQHVAELRGCRNWEEFSESLTWFVESERSFEKVTRVLDSPSSTQEEKNAARLDLLRQIKGDHLALRSEIALSNGDTPEEEL